MAEDLSNPSLWVARCLKGYFLDREYQEDMCLEYRYSPKEGFLLYSRIREQDYIFRGRKFFETLSELLDQLPLTSSITLLHYVYASVSSANRFIKIEEVFYPYHIRDTGTVVYQIRAHLENRLVETQKHNSFGYAMEEVRNLLGENFIRVCYFCENLIEYNEFGGTDYRHDQLHCFRDQPAVLNELMKTYPKLLGAEKLLALGVSDMDALHSCSAFKYRPTPRP